MSNENIYDAIERALSASRIATYKKHSSSTEDAFAKYFWNLELSASLHTALSLFEVSLRNELHFRIRLFHAANVKRSYQHGVFWFDDERLMYRSELTRIEDARFRLQSKEDPEPTEDQIVASLSMGFWCALFESRYVDANPNYFGLWPGLWRPEPFFRYCRGQNRNNITLSKLIEPIHRLRNRVAHHEPIYHRSSLLGDYNNIKTLLGWMDPLLVEQLDAICEFEQVYHRGAAGCRWMRARVVTSETP